MVSLVDSCLVSIAEDDGVIRVVDLVLPVPEELVPQPMANKPLISKSATSFFMVVPSFR